VTPARATADVARNIFLVATEESGDRLGASLMKVLRQRLGGAVRFDGVGGRSMMQEGLSSLFPIEELSIIGLAAIAKRLPTILRRIRETADAVTEASSDILVIIDSPDFTHRVARRVRARNPAIPIIEPEQYRRLGGPPCSYVGHPLIEQVATLRPGPAEQQRRDRQPPVLLVLPGSRRSEIRHHLAIFGAALGRLRALGIAFEPVLPTMPHLEQTVRAGVKSWPVAPRVVLGEADKRAAFRIAHAALAKSGTVTLELALAGVPMVAAYRAGAAEAWILQRAINVSSIILANLVIGENVVPEFLQNDCSPEKLGQALRDVLTDSALRRRQVEAFAGIDRIMATGDQPPSVRAADIVLAALRRSRELA
jgi:lipid-A-disaccharide synthase